MKISHYYHHHYNLGLPLRLLYASPPSKSLPASNPFTHSIQTHACEVMKNNEKALYFATYHLQLENLYFLLKIVAYKNSNRLTILKTKHMLCIAIAIILLSVVDIVLMFVYYLYLNRCM